MSLEQYNPFWVPFWKIKVNGWLSKKYKLLSLVDWNNTECKRDSHFTDYFLETSYAKSFADLIIEELTSFSTDLQRTINIKEVWAQRYTGSHYMSPHTHGNHGFSGILYTEFNPEVHKPTSFYGPFKGFTDGMDLEHTPEVEEGDMIIFPSSIVHYVEPSDNEEQRTIFSWNMK